MTKKIVDISITIDREIEMAWMHLNNIVIAEVIESKVLGAYEIRFGGDSTTGEYETLADAIDEMEKLFGLK